MIAWPVDHAESSSGGSAARPIRKNVNWYPKRGSLSPASASRPVKYHHSVRYAGCARWSRGKDHA